MQSTRKQMKKIGEEEVKKNVYGTIVSCKRCKNWHCFFYLFAFCFLFWFVYQQIAYMQFAERSFITIVRREIQNIAIALVANLQKARYHWFPSIRYDVNQNAIIENYDNSQMQTISMWSGVFFLFVFIFFLLIFPRERGSTNSHCK